jgi:hypothetical protein
MYPIGPLLFDRYLDQAAHTVLGMWNVSRWYSQMGLMVGSVFLECADWTGPDWTGLDWSRA